MKLVLNALKYFALAVMVIVVEQIPLLFVYQNQPFYQVLVLSVIILLIAAASCLLAYRCRLIQGYRVLLTRSAILTVLLGFILLYIVKMVGAVILYLEQGGQASTGNQTALQNLGMHPMLFITFAVIVAPIVEEIACRGLIQGLAFKNSYLGVVISSLVFGALHVPTDIGSWVLYGGMGLVLGLIYHKFEKLEYTVAIHMLNNGIAMLMLFLV